MYNLLITGSTGFIGSHLVHHFTELSCAIDTVNRSLVNNELVRNEFLWNQMNEINISKYRAVIHLAGQAHDTRDDLLLDQYEQANIGLFQLLLEQCVKTPPEKMLLFSTIKVLGSSWARDPGEDAAPEPDSIYGSTKLSAEQLLVDAHTDQMKGYILRPALIFGEPFKGNLKTLSKLVSKNLPLPLAGLQNVRSYLSIANLNYVIERVVIGDEVTGGVYHLDDDQPLKTTELVELIAQRVGKPPPSIKLPHQLLHILARMGELTGRGFNMDSYQKVTSSLIVSNDKIKSALAIDRMPFNLKPVQKSV